MTAEIPINIEPHADDSEETPAHLVVRRTPYCGHIDRDGECAHGSSQPAGVPLHQAAAEYAIRRGKPVPEWAAARLALDAQLGEAPVVE